MYSRGSSGSTRTCCSHARASVKPLRSSRAVGLLRRRERPRPRPAGQRGLGDRVDRRLHGRDVAGAAALGDEPAARPQRRVQPLEQPVVVGDPVERRGREDRVDRLVQLELEQVGGEHLDARAEPLARLRHHRRRPVDRDDLAARQALDQRGGHAAGAAAGVEHALVAAQLEPVEHLAPHRLHRRRDPLVGLGVPVARHQPPDASATYAATASMSASLSESPNAGMPPRPPRTMPATVSASRPASSSDGPAIPLVPASASVWQRPAVVGEDRLAVRGAGRRGRLVGARRAYGAAPAASVRGCVSSSATSCGPAMQHDHEGGGQQPGQRREDAIDGREHQRAGKPLSRMNQRPLVYQAADEQREHQAARDRAAPRPAGCASGTIVTFAANAP